MVVFGSVVKCRYRIAKWLTIRRNCRSQFAKSDVADFRAKSSLTSPVQASILRHREESTSSGSHESNPRMVMRAKTGHLPRSIPWFRLQAAFHSRTRRHRQRSARLWQRQHGWRSMWHDWTWMGVQEWIMIDLISIAPAQSHQSCERALSKPPCSISCLERRGNADSESICSNGKKEWVERLLWANGVYARGKRVNASNLPSSDQSDHSIILSNIFCIWSVMPLSQGSPSSPP